MILAHHRDASLYWFILIITIGAGAAVLATAGSPSAIDNNQLLECPSGGAISQTGLEGSVSIYDPWTAQWTFHLDLTIPGEKDVKRNADGSLGDIVFRIWLKTNHAAGIQIDRFLTTDHYERYQEDRQVNLTVTFDHSYDGKYRLEVETCHYLSNDPLHPNCPVRSTNSGPGLRIIHLCPVQSPLNDGQLDVHEMNISISMTPNHHNGATVEFVVDYENVTKDFLPFREYLVELQATEPHRPRAILSFKARTKWSRVEFRNCSNSDPSHHHHQSCWDDELTEKTVCCFPLPAGNYTSAVNPIDSRCNVHDVTPDDHLEIVRATESTELPCLRHTRERPIELRSLPRGLGSVMTTDSSVSFWLIALLLVFASIVLLGAFVYLRKLRNERRAHRWNTNKQLADHEDEAVTTGGKNHQEGFQPSSVLLIYEMGIRERAAILRKQLKAFAISQVYDCGDESQEEDVNIAGIQNWFMDRIYDPSVRIVVILSPGLLRRPDEHQELVEHEDKLLAFLLGQLMAVNVAQSRHGRIFAVSFEDPANEVMDASSCWLSPFVRYELPGHLEQLVAQLNKRPTCSESSSVFL